MQCLCQKKLAVEFYPKIPINLIQDLRSIKVFSANLSTDKGLGLRIFKLYNVSVYVLKDFKNSILSVVDFWVSCCSTAKGLLNAETG